MWGYYCFVFQLLVLLQFSIDSSLACNGYAVEIERLENCAGDGQIIKLDPATKIELTADCKMAVIGCVTSKAFKEANVKYRLEKKPFPPMSGSVDACKAMSKIPQHISMMMAMFNIPSKCPVDAHQTCSTADQKVDVSPIKNYLGMAKGKFSVDLDIQHEQGKKSCIKVVGNLVQKGKKN